MLTLAARYEFSTTSGRRSVKRNAAVGGSKNSRHLLWLAEDVVLDDPVDEPAFCDDAKRLGLRFLPEGDHIHVQAP